MYNNKKIQFLLLHENNNKKSLGKTPLIEQY